MAKNPSQHRAQNNSSQEVEAANKRMLTAWKAGNWVLTEFGERSAYGATKRAAAELSTNRENVRRYRIVAQRIRQPEIDELCRYCLQHEWALGPAYLVAFSELRHKRERVAFWKKAVRSHWTLVVVRRELRRHGRAADSSVRETQRRGRKRNVDWTSESEILGEIERLARSWERFRAELTEDASGVDSRAGIAALSSIVRRNFEEVSASIKKLNRSVSRRLDKRSPS